MNGFTIALSIGHESIKVQNYAKTEYVTMQRETLAEILKANAETEYGKLYEFSAIHNEEEFAEKVPLTTYRVYKPYVNRMLKGNERNLLFSEELTGFSSTSATSGSIKLIPQNKSVAQAFLKDFALRALVYAEEITLKEDGYDPEDGYLYILMGCPVQFIEGEKGRQKLAVSAISALSLLHVQKEMFPRAIPPIPLLAEYAYFVKELYYLYLRFGLNCKEIYCAVSIYDDYILGLLRYLNSHWKTLCDEIEAGTSLFDPEILKLPELQAHLKFLKPNPERADELRNILKDGLKEDTVHRIWPKLKVFSAAAKIGEFLKDNCLENYLKGIAYDCSPYGATEGLFGVAASLEDRRIQLLPYSSYYEFIPVENVFDDLPRVLRMDELEDDKLYELVVTTRAGLYRYRIGDLLRVSGRIGTFPLFTFEGRNGIGIDLVSEKSPESALRNSLTVAAVKQKIPIKGFCMYGKDEQDTEFESPERRYVVQFESVKQLNDSELSAFVKEIDHQISCLVKSYASARKTGALMMPEVMQMPKGSFAAFDEKMIQQSLNPGQYKRPFIMKLGEF